MTKSLLAKSMKNHFIIILIEFQNTIFIIYDLILLLEAMLNKKTTNNN
jgi:hypothetical protein